MRKKPDHRLLNILKKRVRSFDFDQRPEGTLFGHLAESIVSQQLSIKAAATIYGRFEGLFANKLPTPAAVLKLTHAQLRSVGLSEAKARAIQDLALKTLEGVVPTDEEARELSDLELIERLSAVRGIGKWTVEMVLIFRYRRPDVWPVDDLVVQKGFRLLFPKLKFKSARELDKHGVHWKGQRTLIAWYCWRAIEEERAQCWDGVAIDWEGHQLLLWLKGGEPVYLDFKRTGKTPKALWPGKVALKPARKALWQRRLKSQGLGQLKLGPGLKKKLLRS